MYFGLSLLQQGFDDETMCGIAGLITSRTDVEINGILRSMADSIRHRGPDDEGYFQTSTTNGEHQIGLAHRRLSIIDLQGGHQPLGNEDGHVQIVFNGEIYNYKTLRAQLIESGHRFATDSDTETIVHAYEQYGERCVNHLQGMFAFAIWDANKQCLFLARDRFGKKPLYVYQDANTLLFASEIKAILRYPKISTTVDHAAVAQYLRYRYVPGPQTLFSGIHKLEPGSWMTWQQGQCDEVRYFWPNDRQALNEPVKVADPIGGFLAQLTDAVQDRMMSDVPYGAFLSGGIDSSAIVALMARHSALPVQTFSVGFDESQYSELGYARDVANLAGSEHHELTITQQELMDELPSMIEFRDAPVSEPSDIPIYLLAKCASQTVKMVLTGEGGDEVLGGYPKHVFERYASAYHRVPSFIRQQLIEPLVHALPYRFQRAKTAAHSLGIEQWEARMPSWFGSNIDATPDALTTGPVSEQNFDNPYHLDTASDNSALRRILYFDQTSWLPDNLLERGDRMTMANSLEARMPFLDYRLAQFVSKLPDEFRVKGRTSKWILRKAMERVLPHSILTRPKVGFRVPVNEWFRGAMRDFLLDHLSGPGMQTRHYYDAKQLDKVITAHLQGRHNHEKLLWTLLNLELWHRRYAHTP